MNTAVILQTLRFNSAIIGVMLYSNQATVPAELMSAISSNWGGINQKSAVGYISGLPVISS